MVNQQTLQGNWNEIKGKLRNKWGQLTNDDLQSVHGNVDQLIGLIQRKTGEARNSVEQFLEEARQVFQKALQTPSLIEDPGLFGTVFTAAQYFPWFLSKECQPGSQRDMSILSRPQYE